MEGWICPAMFRYYKTAPKNLYVKAEPTRRAPGQANRPEIP
jgi:hypothetical protein